MRFAVRLAFFAVMLRGAVAQTQPDVAQILRKVGDTYKAASQYEIESESTGRGADTTSGHMRLTFKPPKKYRMEGSFSGLSGDAAAFGKPVIICDGSFVWFYLQKSNQYASFPLSEVTPDAAGDLGDLRPEAVDEFVMVRYRRAADFTEGAKLLREEPVEFAGRKLECYVLAIPEKHDLPASTWWVDKKSYRILREDHAESSTVYTTIKLNEPLHDQLFTFKPPPDAHKLEMNR